MEYLKEYLNNDTLGIIKQYYYCSCNSEEEATLVCKEIDNVDQPYGYMLCLLCKEMILDPYNHRCPRKYMTYVVNVVTLIVMEELYAKI